MYPVSADFHNLSIADAPTSRVRIYFIEANVDCTDDNDVQSNGTLLCMPGETDSNGRIEKGGVTINEFFNSDTNVQIGATVSSQIGMTLINRDGALDGFNYGRCKVYIDVYDDTNSTWLTCPMGVYNIAIPKRRKVQLVSATGYDQMQQLDEIADSWWNGLDWSNGITLLQIIQSMAATLGIHLSANTSANIVNSGLSYTEIPFTAIEMTYRDILSYIAETTGTIARFDRNGALDLRWFSDAVLSTDTQTYAGGLVTFTATDRASISSLSVPFSPIQNLNGYANPWPAGGGVNKFDIASSAPSTSHPYGFTISADVNTGYVTIEGTYTGSGGAAFTIFPNSSVPAIANTTYYIVDANEDAAAHIYKIRANNTTDGTGIAVQTTGTTNGETYNMVFRIMRVLSSEPAPTSWSPYSNICPISGRTGLSVYDDPKYGGTINWNQIASPVNKTASTTYGITTVVTNNEISITGTPTQTAGVWRLSFENVSFPDGHIALLIARSDNFFFRLQGETSYTTKDRGHFLVRAGQGWLTDVVIQMTNLSTTHYYEESCYIQLFDLTQIFGETKADEILAMEQSEAGSGVAYFKALLYKDYYPYNSGTTTCVSAVNGDPYWKTDIDWSTQAGTVYHGTVDPVTGQLTVDWASVLFDGSSDETWYWHNSGVAYGLVSGGFITNATTQYDALTLCDKLQPSSWVSRSTKDNSCGMFYGASYVFIRNTNSITDAATARTWLAANPITVMYPLATPLTYQLTPQEIAALVGTNNVWSTGDSVSVTVSEPTLVEIQTDTVGNQCLSIDVGEYQVSQIDALSVKASQADVGVTIGSGGNAYTILDNPMLFGDEAAITTKATPIYNRLSAFRLFTPISMRCIMDWSIEAGDIITVTNESVTYDLPIFQQRLRWRGGYVVSDLFSNGEQERPTQSKEIRSSFRSKTQMHEFEVTLEQLRSYIQSVDGNYTLIQQTVDTIAQTVANQNVTIQNILDPTGEIWTAITKNTSNLSSIEDSLNNEITERRSYIRFIPSEPAIVMGVDEDNEIKLKLVNNIIYFFNGADDSTDLSLAYAYFNSQEAFADRFVAGESVQIGTNDNAAHWLWKKLNNGDLVLELVG